MALAMRGTTKRGRSRKTVEKNSPSGGSWLTRLLLHRALLFESEGELIGGVGFRVHVGVGCQCLPESTALMGRARANG
eukprot:774561-Lingulodinium_polyedra.AAC.1